VFETVGCSIRHQVTEPEMVGPSGLAPETTASRAVIISISLWANKLWAKWITLCVYIVMPQCQKCQQVFPNRQKINGKIRILNKRKFCLKCSPFGAHNTRTLNQGPKTEHWCPKCEKLSPIKKFYMRRNGQQPSPYCIYHTHLETVSRQRRFKKQCVDYKGGKCYLCGYTKSINALHFHHRDPKIKEATISQLKSFNFERAKPELDKCDLVCANCHAELHEKVI
jgi:hypothetical protein